MTSMRNVHPNCTIARKAKRMQKPKRALSRGVRISPVGSMSNCLATKRDRMLPMAFALTLVGSHPREIPVTVRTCRIDIGVRRVVVRWMGAISDT